MRTITQRRLHSTLEKMQMTFNESRWQDGQALWRPDSNDFLSLWHPLSSVVAAQEQHQATPKLTRIAMLQWDDSVCAH
jgi:hypothetical protein